MWQRRTFHECASELSAISEDFRSAHTNKFGWDRAKRDRIMRDTSTRGVEVLRILALSIRADQDAGLTGTDPTSVGAFRSNATEAEALAAVRTYRPPCSQLPGFVPLKLRQALNKIAHADPTCSGFFADDTTHDLVLTGVERGAAWIAVVSLIELCRVVKSLPDANTRQ
jgi:hypothetical protein